MDIIFVVGMGRSGTSAITRILSLCGAALPDRVLRSGPGNPRGYWEAEVALKRNDQFLKVLESSYHDPGLGYLEKPISEQARKLHARNLRSFLSALPNTPAVVVKDPRISALVGSWDAEARFLGMAPKYVHMFRHPSDVAASLHARYGMPKVYSDALWLKYNLLPERMTRHAPRVFASYRELLENWQQIVRKCRERLRLALSIDDEAIDEVGKFLTPDLQHHRTAENEPVEDATPSGWVNRTYSMLRRAEQTGEIDQLEADRIFAEYTGAERFFREAQQNYSEQFSSPSKAAPARKRST